MIFGLSLTTLLLVGAVAAGKLFRCDVVSAAERKVLYVAVLLLGLAFYAMALGVGSFDPYALGFAGGGGLRAVLLAALASSLLALVFRQGFLLLVLLAAVAAFSLGLGVSQNLWDYLLDPWLVAVAGIRLALDRAGLTIA